VHHRFRVRDDVLVADALREFYSAHGLPADGGVSQSSFSVRVGPLPLTLPNPPARKRAVFFHDVNHLLTGYNAKGLDGEVVIAGFEVGAGCGRYWIAWIINLGAFAVALVMRPRELFAAFVRGRRSHSIYRRSESREVLRTTTVGALRRMLNIDVAPPIATEGDRVAFAGWALVAVLFALSPLIVAAAIALAWSVIA
jgi:hypothetical protein